VTYLFSLTFSGFHTRFLCVRDSRIIIEATWGFISFEAMIISGAVKYESSKIRFFSFARTIWSKSCSTS